jgi:environmental stress-induced protein Ves
MSNLQVKHLKVSDYQIQPWRNGQGVTRQILAEASDPYRWRLSWSEINGPGPFSDFSGYDRTLVLLGNTSISLKHGDAEPKRLQPLSPYSFAGEGKTVASLQEKTEDLNLFCFRGKASGSVHPTRLKKDEEYLLPYRGQHHFIFVVEGSVAVHERNLGQEIILGTRETAHLSRTGKGLALDSRVIGRDLKNTVLWIVIREI